MSKLRIFLLRLLFPFVVPILNSCSLSSTDGPLKRSILDEGQPFQIVEIKSEGDVPRYGRSYGRSSRPPSVKGQGYSDRVRSRDALSISITDLTEQSPFYSQGAGLRYGPIEVPSDGRVSVPYLGEIQVIGKSLSDVTADIERSMKQISATAQVAVSRNGRISETANVIGSVKEPGPKRLERDGYTSIDLIADSGGASMQEHLAQYVLRRNGRDYRFDYQGFMKNPFIVEAGDLLTVSQDLTNRVHLMGSLRRSSTMPFPNPNPTLADILGIGGLDERRADASGVFIFRKGNPDTVYVINMKEPASFAHIQQFAMKGEDIVYVTEAPLARWNRMLSQLFAAVTAPVSQATSAAYNFDRLQQ